MKFFGRRNQYDGYNIYRMKKKIEKRRLAVNIIIGIILAITLILVIYYIIDTKIRVKQSKEFSEQFIEYQTQQEEILKEQEEERLAKIPKLTQEGKENIKNIYKTENKRVFLTFDDGPSTNTKSILDILKEKDIKATFFVLGNQVEVWPETINRMYNEGHYIANHGYSHIYSNVYKSPETVLDEFNKCNQVISETIGVPEYNSHLFRFPGGSVGGKYSQIKSQAITLLEQNDILHLDWNALTGDSEKVNPTEEYLMENLRRTTNGKNSVVILMHDSPAKKITVDTLPKVIEYLQQQGYEFENFYNIIK